MADATPEDGWTTVHRPFQAHPDRLPPSQRELYERALIKEWEASNGHWSGIGKHPDDFAEAKKIHHKIIAPKDNDLGMGSFGRVERVTHRSVCLARKWIKPQRNQTFHTLRREAIAMERLDHEHIVKLVGTYTFKLRELYLLIWPVAVCNLGELLTDLEDLRSGQGDREYILKRLETLNVTDLGAIGTAGRHAPSDVSKCKCPLKFLQRTMGCIAQAITHCHTSKVRHLDLKPSNILLNPDKVYLADFGIARDVHDQDNTATMGPHGTPRWRPPEAYDMEEYSSQYADIYSLGLIYLNIATLVYHGNFSEFHSVIGDLAPLSRAEKLKTYQQNLALHALATQQFHDVKRPTVAPRHILDLTARMLSSESKSRPRADQVDQELVDLGGIEQVYHNACCRKSTRHVTNRIDEKLSVVSTEIDKLRPENERLKKEIEVLKGMDETYRMRIVNQEKKHARDTDHLTKQLDEERQKRRKLEEKVNQLEKQSRRHGRTSLPRADANIDSRRAFDNAAVDFSNGLGINMRPRTHPMPQAAVRPPPTTTLSSSAVPRPAMPTRVPIDPPKAWVTRNFAVMAGVPGPEPASRTPESPSPNPQTPNGTLVSRGSGSRLPILAKIPATPRSGTPKLARDPSMTDSTQASMSSSIFSRRSFETNTEAASTPPSMSPAVKQAGFDIVVREVPDFRPACEPPSPVFSAPKSVSSVLSSPCTTKAELASVAGSEISHGGFTSVKVPPSLQPTKSWAAVAGESHGLAKMVGPPPQGVISPTSPRRFRQRAG
ncbi:hypothetical protein EsH8_V_000043 [Colletotrichum jinshuiense]